MLLNGARSLVGFMSIVMAGTIVLSESRAGTAPFLVEMGLLLGLLVGRKKNGRIAAALGTLCLMVLAFVAWLETAA